MGIYTWITLIVIMWIISGQMVICDASETELDIFQHANKLYKAEKYKEAAEEYERLIHMGIRNGIVYYNLGNAYFKSNQLGKAILYYERAKRFMPRDEDILANLRYVNLLIVDKVDTEKLGSIKGWIYRLYHILSINEQTVLVSLIYTVIIILCIIAMFLYNKRLITRLIITTNICISIIFVVCICSLVIRCYSMSHTPEAIVMESKVSVKSGPSTELETMFYIHEGTKIRIREMRDEWYQIELKDKIGWIKKDMVEII